MGYVILVIALVVFCGAKINDYVSYRRLRKQNVRMWADILVFRAKYTDQKLEDTIRDNIKCRTEEEKKPIYEEVFAAYNQMEHWVGYKDPLVLKDDIDMAVDIMLANRGKISSHAELCGYTSHLGEGGSIAKDNTWALLDLYERQIKQREFVEWIRDTLQKQGVVVRAVVRRGYNQNNAYAWEGSFASQTGDNTVFPLMSSVKIKKPVIPTPSEIPDPYYKKK